MPSRARALRLATPSCPAPRRRCARIRRGLRGDIDQFVGWVNHIAVAGLPNTFEQELTFGPVVAYIWWFLGLIEPGFRTATDASDTTIRVLMKLPATLADFGLARSLTDDLGLTQFGQIVGTPRSISLNRRLPSRSSRMIKGTQRSHNSSDAFDTGQNWPYRTTPRR